MKNDRLTLTVTSEYSEYSPGTRIFIQVILKNVSAEPLWINKRMAMGYEDSPERELYMTVHTPDGQVLPVPETERVDVHLMPLKREDFMSLEPGGVVKAVVDASIWFPFRQSGRFHIVFAYDNDTGGEEFDVEAFVGTVNADPLVIVLQ